MSSHSGCGGVGHDRTEPGLSSQTPWVVQADSSNRHRKSAVALYLMAGVCMLLRVSQGGRAGHSPAWSQLLPRAYEELQEGREWSLACASLAEMRLNSSLSPEPTDLVMINIIPPTTPHTEGHKAVCRNRILNPASDLEEKSTPVRQENLGPACVRESVRGLWSRHTDQERKARTAPGWR